MAWCPATGAEPAAVEGESSGKNYENPSHFFAVTVPANFQCKNDEKLLYCDSPDGTVVSVTVAEVPVKAHVGLVALVYRQKYRKQSQFKLIQEKKGVVDQVPAIVQAFSYHELANVQLQQFAQQIFVVQANKLLTIEFFCSAALSDRYSAVFERIHQSLRMARLSAAGKPLNRPQVARSSVVVNRQLESLLNSFR